MSDNIELECHVTHFISRLAPDILDPDPENFTTNEKGEKKRGSEALGPGGETGGWSGEATRGQGFRTEDMEVNITFGEEKNKGREVKEQPTWMTESTVTAASEPGSSMGPSMSLVTQEADMEEPEGNDEITEMLLRNERSNKDKAGIVIPGDDSDSDNKSDDSDAIVEQPGYDDAALLAASFNNAERDDDEVEEMEDDSDENDDIPTIKVGGEDYDITDVTPDVIAKMSSEELDKYNQLYQDFYKDMYD